MNRASSFARLALATFVAAAPLALGAQDLPESLKDQALAVHFNARLPGAGEGAGWGEQSTKFTVPGTPVSMKLVGPNAVILVQVTPFRVDGSGITLVTQGQIWVHQSSGLSYRTSLDTVTIAFGETVVFYPLGVGSDGKAPIRVEISVANAASPPSGQALPPSPPAQGPPTDSPKK